MCIYAIRFTTVPQLHTNCLSQTYALSTQANVNIIMHVDIILRNVHNKFVSATDFAPAYVIVQNEKLGGYSEFLSPSMAMNIHHERPSLVSTKTVPQSFLLCGFMELHHPSERYVNECW
eukprot:Platyproteum_vivax@DN7234_c0_g1_i6.p1